MAVITLKLYSHKELYIPDFDSYVMKYFYCPTSIPLDSLDRYESILHFTFIDHMTNVWQVLLSNKTWIS